MATNEILPFAQAGGANVLSQAEYAADPQRIIGNQPGIARANFVNKAALQASAMAAGLGQWIADYQAVDVTDQKTAAELSAMIADAVLASGPQIATTAQAEAQTDNATYITPLRLSQALQGANQSKTPNGFQRFPGGIIIQWTTATLTTAPTAFNFPTAFPVVCLAAGVFPGSTGNIPAITSKNDTQFVASVSTGTTACQIMAIGH